MSLGYPLLRLPSRCSLAASAAPRLGSLSPLPISVSLSASASASSNGSGGDGELTARERRQQRRERRELRATDWKEEVQDRLIHEPARRRKKPPKRTWREELNLDLLAELGPQWWLVRVSMAPGTDYVDLLTKAISRRFSEVPFKLHDFIRDTEGCYGFIGATVGSIKRQIKKPKPIPLEEIESIIKEEKEEQERVDREFEEMDNMGNVESLSKPVEDSELMLMNKIKKQFKKSPAKSIVSLALAKVQPGLE
ncbi:hypothetical protein PR202_gb10418 [Eleusine coracana subsp. coracana]|uniref:Uncharacterized protein n=1 Tax=Eleusine coracana subsp. coracana TaxID=191504 RepID=A0AAV5EJU2_ELECO|nr:hypothetical protein PR202_gb10418 [Eleusine coracana subsp. coracana]